MKTRFREDGFILVVLLVLSAVLLLLGSGMALMAQSSLQASGNVRAGLRAKQAVLASRDTALAVLPSLSTEQLQTDVSLAPPLESTLQGKAILHLLKADPAQVLIEIRSEGHAEREGMARLSTLVQGTRQADPEWFSGISSMQRITYSTAPTLKNEATLLVRAATTGQPEMPFPAFAPMVSALGVECQQKLGGLRVDSQAQWDVLFPAGSQVCIQGDLQIHAPILIQDIKMQVMGKLSSLFPIGLHNSMVVTQQARGLHLEMENSTLLSPEPMTVQTSLVTGNNLLFSGQNLSVTLQNSAAEANTKGILSLVAQQNLQVNATGNHCGVLWAGGNLTYSGTGELQGAMAARGPVVLTGPTTVVRDETLGHPLIPGPWKYRILSEKRL
ncbi:hypothetical protein [Deinococcus misasensis]|uniref:hypothetical protein n=1 Tax=Deinococcus misasensis TaxID=392413 RepID=UPI0005586D66|nr:hypothetical protein [Deinococcus misasensis]